MKGRKKITDEDLSQYRFYSRGIIKAQETRNKLVQNKSSTPPNYFDSSSGKLG